MSNQSETTPSEILFLSLASEIPRDVTGWVTRDFEVHQVSEPAESVALIREFPERFAAILIVLDRDQVDDAVRACRDLRTAGVTPVVLATDDAVRVADRVRALKAGASDFLSRPLSVAELSSRIERAMSAGGAVVVEHSVSPLPTEEGEGFLEAGPFAFAVERRLSHPGYSIFTLVSIRRPGDDQEADALSEALLDCARGTEGDCVGSLQKGFGVVLQGASIGQASAFMDRVRGALPEDFPVFEWAAQSGTVSPAQILGELGDPRRFRLPKTGS